jgi:hypothetical protein
MAARMTFMEGFQMLPRPKAKESTSNRSVTNDAPSVQTFIHFLRYKSNYFSVSNERPAQAGIGLMLSVDSHYHKAVHGSDAPAS